MADLEEMELDDEPKPLSSTPLKDVNDPELDKYRPIVYEFVHQLEKSKELFNRLRELPKYSQKIWQPYFARAFEVYTNLWKCQQQNRDILEKMYGLKRWQIGEIASKIGQLYYQYYLRTSEANYLFEAFSFYSAIRLRSYYAKSKKEQKPDVMLKKLRYVARYIVVCLLLRKMETLQELVQDLGRHVEEYKTTYKVDDNQEWSLVLNEIRSFIVAEEMVSITDSDGSSVLVSNRFLPGTLPRLERALPMYYSLKDILIVGSSTSQVKFSELSMDMYRMLQVFEYEPQEELIKAQNSADHHDEGRTSSARQTSTPADSISSKGSDKRRNPHKYLLYKPTIAHFLSYLATSFSELPTSGVLLLYFSSDEDLLLPVQSQGEDEERSHDPFEQEGVPLAAPKSSSDVLVRKKGLLQRDINSLLPGDLLTYTRKPLFLIIDSPRASSFEVMQKLFNQPLVVLMSPSAIPAPLKDLENQGRLMTSFLSNPTMAFLTLCGHDMIAADKWEKCLAVMSRFMVEASRAFISTDKVGQDYLQFFADPFLRIVILRFVFYSICLVMHNGFMGSSMLPSAYPPLPEAELLFHPHLQLCVKEMAAQVDMGALFVTSTAPGDL